jgi:uncharacterized secreted protein with C-terminal beta-propeller domain
MNGKKHSLRKREFYDPKSELQLEFLEPRCLLSATLDHGIWTIHGDQTPDNLDDIITIEPDSLNPASLQALVNGQVVDEQSSSEVRTITIFAGKGDDEVRINFDTLTDPIRVHVFGGRGDDLLHGGAGMDLLKGGPGNDTLEGNEGDDRIRGNAGNDQCTGGEGDDKIRGGRGADLVRGDEGADKMIGGRGADLIYADSAEDLILGHKFDTVIENGAVQSSTTVVESDAEFSQWFIDQAVERWSNVLGREWEGFWNIVVPQSIGQLYSTDFYFGGTLMTDAGFSETNVQEIGVDEADLVKTDGEYIYVLGGAELTIVDAWPPEELAVVSYTEIEGDLLGMYFYEDTVTVLSRIWTAASLDDTLLHDLVPDLPTLSFDLVSMPIPMLTAQTKVTVVDVTDRSDPDIKQETYVDGHLISSRAIEDRVYLVTRDYPALPAPQLLEKPDGHGYLYETEAEYRQRLTDTVNDYLPGYTTITTTDQGEVEQSGLLTQPNHTYIPPDTYSGEILSVLMLDVDSGSIEPDAITSIVGGGGTVYATTESLYVVSHSYLPIFTPGVAELALLDTQMPSSFIYKFDLTQPDDIPLAATGTVPGSLLNQFSMDEHEGYFRVATTTHWPDRANHIFVFEQQDDQLNVIGSLTDLAEEEHIESVRFVQDRAYVVTFRVVDPLFTIDLSRPQQPAVAGELKVEGFSAYLHPIDPDHLIGLGFDADENGWNRTLQLSLFDVLDLSNPTRTDTYALSDDLWQGNSEALWDHHAFSFFDDYDVLALPVYSNLIDEAELQVFEVTPEDGFDLLAIIEHDDDIRRSLRIDEFLYALSEEAVSVHDIDDPDSEINYIELFEEND